MIGYWVLFYFLACGEFLVRVNSAETTDDPCFINPCKNDGVCIANSTDYICECKQPYSGNHCERHACHSNPCLNDGACIAVENTYGCVCDEPFYGMHCENDLCTHNPCKNEGSCRVVGQDFSCTCKDRYFGKQCEIVCDCGENGACSFNSSNHKICNCDTGYEINNENICQACDCGNHGKCTFDKEDKKMCTCEKGYSVNNDEKCQKCDCGEKGDCSFNSLGLKICDCEAGYAVNNENICKEFDTTDSEYATTDYFSGEITKNIDECFCGDNSETCRLDWWGKKLCFCNDGFDQRRGTETCSRTCQSNADCRNGGICDRDGPGYFCMCHEPYIGDRCEVDVCSSKRFECYSMRAECVRNGTTGTCKCPKGKKMSPYNYCEDTCTSETCVHGVCELTGSSSRYSCVCYDGYYGRHCEIGSNVTLYSPFSGILVILGSGIVLFSIASIIAGCWVKKLRKKIEESAKHNLQP